MAVGRSMKKAVLTAMAMAALAAGAYSYARPMYSVEVDIHDASGNVIGGREYACDGHTYYWGDQNGTPVEVLRYRCR